MRRSMLRPTRRNPYSASLGQSLLAFFQPSLAFAKASPSVKAQAAAPAAAAGPLAVGSVTDDTAKLDALPAGSIILLGFKLPQTSKIIVAPVQKVKTLTASAGWLSTEISGKFVGQKQPSVTTFMVSGADWAALVLRVGGGSIGPAAETFATLQAALPDPLGIPVKATVAQSLADWFASSPFATGAAPAVAEKPDVLPPGMAWVNPPFTSANIKAIAPAHTGSDYLDPGSVIALYYTDGERAFFQRVSNYDVRKLDASTGEYAGYAEMLGSSFTSPSGGDTMAILYMGDADAAMDDPDAMLELLAKAPATAKGAPGYKPPTPVVLYEPTPTYTAPEPEPEPAAPTKPKKGTAAGQSIKSLTATSMKTLAPFIKKAAAKVEGVTVEAKTGQVTMTKGSGSVRVASVSGSDITFAFTDAATGATATKSMTIPLPDAAANVATVIAQAMVYFLVYTLRSKGKAHEEVPLPLPVTIVDGVALVPGATVTTEAQRAALPAGAWLAPVSEGVNLADVDGPAAVSLPATLRYLPVPDWEKYYLPLANTPKELAYGGVVVPAPKRPGWPASSFAPTLAAYSSLPIGTLVRTEVGTGTVYAVRESVQGFRKIDPSTGDFTATSTTVRSPSKLAQDALASNPQVFVVYLGENDVKPPSVYLAWLGGVEVDKADALASEAVAQVEQLAAALGIDPRVAALFTPAVLQVMLKQKGIPYAGKTFTPPKPPGSPLLANPSRHREAVRRVLRNPNPSTRDLRDAELLEAAGLPLHDCLPANRRRNPADGATAQEASIIKGVIDALKAALGDGPQPKLHSSIVQTINTRLGNMYSHGDNDGSLTADKMSRPEYAELAQFLRYLVAARVVGLWKNYIDPGERAVTRGLGLGVSDINDPSQSLRPNEVTLQQVALLKGKGLLTTPTTLFSAANTWLRHQATGVGWYRPDTNAKWVATNDLTPPYTANLPSLDTYQTKNIFQAATAMTTVGEYGNDDTWQGPTPYPKWAGEPWANVEGLCIDYYDQTFKKYVISEWSAPLFGYASPSSFQVRANTRDPRFVLLPGTVLGQGPMKRFRGEGAVIFVTIDDKFPLKVDIITVGDQGNSPGHNWQNPDYGRLTDQQLIAWGTARPAFPSGPKPGPSNGPAFAMPPKTNPSRVNAKSVHALLFARSKWGPGAVRSWLAKNGMEGLAVEAAGGAWRVGVYAAEAFAPGSIQRQNVADGVVALVGRPV